MLRICQGYALRASFSLLAIVSTPSSSAVVTRYAARTVAAALTGAVLLGACSSTSVPVMRSETPAIYLQSRRTPEGLAACLARRLPDAHLGPGPAGDGAEVLVSGHAWLIDVSPSPEGTLIAAHRGSDGDAIEPDVRFAIARCAL
ncbi:MAG: hypothetical protein ACRYHA_31260 [Janthinobacterium lividum]